MTASRRSDPATSHAAALSLDIPKSHATVLMLLRHGPATDEALCDLAGAYALRISTSRIRTARSELQRQGLVRDTGRTATLGSGRQAIVWDIERPEVAS